MSNVHLPQRPSFRSRLVTQDEEVVHSARAGSAWTADLISALTSAQGGLLSVQPMF
jgi:hypothetical protein